MGTKRDSQRNAPKCRTTRIACTEKNNIIPTKTTSKPIRNVKSSRNGADSVRAVNSKNQPSTPSRTPISGNRTGATSVCRMNKDNNRSVAPTPSDEVKLAALTCEMALERLSRFLCPNDLTTTHRFNNHLDINGTSEKRNKNANKKGAGQVTTPETGGVGDSRLSRIFCTQRWRAELAKHQSYEDLWNFLVSLETSTLEELLMELLDVCMTTSLVPPSTVNAENIKGSKLEVHFPAALSAHHAISAQAQSMYYMILMIYTERESSRTMAIPETFSFPLIQDPPSQSLASCPTTSNNKLLSKAHGKGMTLSGSRTIETCVKRNHSFSDPLGFFENQLDQFFSDPISSACAVSSSSKLVGSKVGSDENLTSLTTLHYSSSRRSGPLRRAVQKKSIAVKTCKLKRNCNTRKRARSYSSSSASSVSSTSLSSSSSSSSSTPTASDSSSDEEIDDDKRRTTLVRHSTQKSTLINHGRASTAKKVVERKKMRKVAVGSKNKNLINTTDMDKNIFLL